MWHLTWSVEWNGLLETWNGMRSSVFSWFYSAIRPITRARSRAKSIERTDNGTYVRSRSSTRHTQYAMCNTTVGAQYEHGHFHTTHIFGRGWCVESLGQLRCSLKIFSLIVKILMPWRPHRVFLWKCPYFLVNFLIICLFQQNNNYCVSVE